MAQSTEVTPARADEAADSRGRFASWLSVIAAGVAAAALIAVVARVSAPLLRPVPDVVIALVIGIAIRNLTQTRIAEPGAKFVTHYVLRGAIVLIGASFTLGTVAGQGSSVLGLVIGLVALAFALGLLLARMARLPQTIAVLVGAGTAICGASAILVTSPIVRAKSTETAYAIATIFTFNVLALLSYPVIGHWLGLRQETFGVWAGTAVNDTSIVIATGFAYGHAAGGVATVVKLTRTVLLLPLAALLAAWFSWKENATTSTAAALRRAIPWFILGFIALAALRSAGLIPAPLVSLASILASFGVVMVLAAVGLNVDLRSLMKMGAKPLLVGLLLGLLMSAVSLGAVLFLGL